MAGYTRADGNDNIANGKVIDADDLDAEFDAIDAAFNSSTGHTHDGSANNGAPITKIGPGQQIQVTTTVLQPKDNNVMDLGIANTKEFKNLYLAGNADIGGTLSVTGTQTLTGNTTLNGVVNIGSDTLAEYISDTVGSMLVSNTESGISVTYQDVDNTLDIDVDDFTITLTGAVTGTGTVTNLANVSIETTATADPTLTLAGDATGSATFTNLGDATLTVAIADNSHSHTSANISDFAESVDDRVNTLMTAGSTISLTYDDNQNTLTVAHGSVTDAASNSTNSGRTYIQSLGFDSFGHVTSVTTGTETVTDTNTTYSISAVDSGDNAIIRLTDSASNTDDVTLVAGTNISITPDGDNITIASSITDTDTTYSISAVDSGDNAIIRLTAGGSGTGDDDVTLVAGTGITLTPSGDNITIASTASAGGGTNLSFNSGNGIDFSANTGTSATGASTSSELFDFYEEGTFTPAIVASSETTAPTYTYQHGKFTRIGNVVYFSLTVKLATVGSNTGYTKITGLPYSAASLGTGTGLGTTGLGAVVNILTDNLSTSVAGDTKAEVIADEIIPFEKSGSEPESYYASIPPSAWTSTTIIEVSGHYIV